MYITQCCRRYASKHAIKVVSTAPTLQHLQTSLFIIIDASVGNDPCSTLVTEFSNWKAIVIFRKEEPKYQ